MRSLTIPCGPAAPGLRIARLRVDAADVGAVAALGALVMAFFARILFTDQALFWGDVLMSFYPARALWQRMVSAFQLPAWNPYIFNGFPTFADAEHSSFYPSMLLNLVLPLHRAYAVDLALHIFLLAAFTYAFLRTQRLAPRAAFLGALIFAFSGFVTVRITQPTLLRTLAWFPLTLILLERAARGVGLRIVPLLAMLFSLQILAGHQQTVVIGTLLAVGHGLWVSWDEAGPASARRARALRLIAAVAMATIVGILLAGIQVVPNVEMIRYSDRSGGKSFNSAAEFSLPLSHLPMLLAPGLFGTPKAEYWGAWLYWEMVGYAGVVAVLLAGAGLILSRRRARWFWGGVALAGVLLAIGNRSPVYWLAYHLIPGISYFRVPARFLFWYGWGIAVLAAFGMDALQAGVTSRPLRRLAVAVGLIGLGILYWSAGGPGIAWLLDRLHQAAMRAPHYTPPTSTDQVLAYLQEVGLREGRRVALLWVGTAALLLAAAWRKMHTPLALGVLIALAGLDLFVYGMNLYPTVSWRQLAHSVPSEHALDLRNGAYRIFTTPNTVYVTWLARMTQSFKLSESALLNYRDIFMPNTNTMRSIGNAWGYVPVRLARVGQFAGLASAEAQRTGGASPMIDFMSARYIYTYADAHESYRLAYRNGFKVWENPRALPRGYLVTDVRVESEEHLAERLARGWDPARTVYLSEAPSRTPDIKPAINPGEIIRREYGTHRLAFDLALHAPAAFVLSDTYYPGWKAYVDGDEIPIYRANHTFRAVLLPASARRLEFVFRPLSFAVGAAISAVTWAAVIGALLVVRRAERLKGDGPA